MPVKVVCPNPECGASYSMMPEQITRGVRCQACGSRFEVADESHDPHATVSSDPGVFRSASAPPTDLPSPFGRYEIVRRLGQGGMGTVYLARDAELERLVALKVPHFEIGTDPEVVERFRREARTAAGFHHPNFCPIYEVGRVGDTHYLAMAFVEGQTLASLVNRDDPMPAPEAARIVRQLALALAEAHRRGIIHRDLKPANVMVDARGTLIIMDFGLARRIVGDESDLTRTGVPMGTPHYMSPEQVRGTKHDLGPATDIYSLGVILYELSTGRRPFDGPVTVVIGAVLHVEPKPPSDIRPGLDADFEAIILRAMSKSVEARYPSMEALAEALTGYVDRPAPGPPSRARWGRVLLASALLIGLLGVSIYSATDKGTFKVEGFAPGMEIRIDGQQVRIENFGEPIVVATGKHELLVTRGELVVQAPKSFQIYRGQESVVKLVAPGESSRTSGPARPIELKTASKSHELPGGTIPARPAPKVAETGPKSGSPENAKNVETPPSGPIKKPIPAMREAAAASVDRGKVWFDQREFGKAFDSYEEGIRLDPGYAIAYKGRGDCWYSRGDSSRAMADYDKAIRLDPKLAVAYYDRGSCWYGKGELARAMADYNEAIRLDPKYAYTYSSLAWILATCPDPQYRDANRAVSVATKACELTFWGDAYSQGTLAAAHAEAGNFDQAVRRQKEAIDLVPEGSKADFRSRLKSYEAKRPYRDSNMKTQPSPGS